MQPIQKKTRFFITTLILSAVLLSFAPQPVEALSFGGKIITSRYRTCNIGVGQFSIPFPLQVIRVQRTGLTKTFVYSYYQSLLQIFGIDTSLYNYYQFFRSGPSVLGTYVPVPIPWSNCPDLSPTNLILKIGTSLY